MQRLTLKIRLCPYQFVPLSGNALKPLVAAITPGCQKTANKTSDISAAALMIFKAVSRFSM